MPKKILLFTHSAMGSFIFCLLLTTTVAILPTLEQKKYFFLNITNNAHFVALKTQFVGYLSVISEPVLLNVNSKYMIAYRKKLAKENEQNPAKIVYGRSIAKQMVTCFFGRVDHVATIPLEQRITISSESYTAISLPEVFREMRKTNPERRIIPHHDNATSHTSRQTSAFSSSQNIKSSGGVSRGVEKLL